MVIVWCGVAVCVGKVGSADGVWGGDMSMRMKTGKDTQRREEDEGGGGDVGGYGEIRKVGGGQACGKVCKTHEHAHNHRLLPLQVTKVPYVIDGSEKGNDTGGTSTQQGYSSHLRDCCLIVALILYCIHVVCMVGGRGTGPSIRREDQRVFGIEEFASLVFGFGGWK